MNASTSVLIVEDDESIGSGLRVAISNAGFDARWVASGNAALDDIESRSPDLILLDLGLPDMDGVALCRRLRERLPDAAIVILTARTAEFEVVIALDAGADDYVTKPFRLNELLARLRAHGRRSPTPVKEGHRLQVGRVRLDTRARRVQVDDTEIPLRHKEFDLLAVLMRSAGEAVSRDRLMTEVWDENWFGPTKTLDVHISILRRKLSEAGEQTDRITTLRGHGYRYERDD
jgi:DNA-binding response OmpR family regulator